MDEFKISKKAKNTPKNRALIKNTWNKWFGWFLSYLPEPMKRSTSNAKEKIIKLFETHTQNKHRH